MLNTTASALLAATMTLTLPIGLTATPASAAHPTTFTASTNTLQFNGLPYSSSPSYGADPLKTIEHAIEEASKL